MPQNLTVELPDLPTRPPQAPAVKAGFAAALPLRGITILAVEDSRFASEALRLMCQRLGARLRRADTMLAARAHLRLYRPDVVLVDLGLPDGRGEVLIREIALSAHAPIVLATSGEAAGRGLALAAGARGFLEKPLDSLHAFQNILLAYLPDRPLALFPEGEALTPDSLALRDDLAHAAELIDAGLSPEGGAYVEAFLTGIAAHARDRDLADALQEAQGQGPHLARIRPLLDSRLSAPSRAFGPKAG